MRPLREGRRSSADREIRSLRRPGSILFHQLDLTRLPCLVIPGLERAVKAEDAIPTLAWNGLDPVALMAFRGGRAEVNVGGGVGIHHDVLHLAANGRKPLIGLEFRTGLIVIHHDRPEVLGRNVRGLKAIFLIMALLGDTSLWLAVLADTGATLLVVANALRLLRPANE